MNHSNNNDNNDNDHISNRTRTITTNLNQQNDTISLNHNNHHTNHNNDDDNDDEFELVFEEDSDNDTDINFTRNDTINNNNDGIDDNNQQQPNSKKLSRLQLLQQRQQELLELDELKAKNTLIVSTNQNDLLIARIPTISRKNIISHTSSLPQSLSTTSSRKQLIQNHIDDLLQTNQTDDNQLNINNNNITTEQVKSTRNNNDIIVPPKAIPLMILDPQIDPLLAAIPTSHIDTTTDQSQLQQLSNSFVNIQHQLRLQQQIQSQSNLQRVQLIKSMIRQSRTHEQQSNETQTLSSSTSFEENLQQQLSNEQQSTITTSTTTTTTTTQQQPKLTQEQKRQQTILRRLNERKSGLLEWRILVKHIHSEFKVIHDLVLDHHIRPSLSSTNTINGNINNDTHILKQSTSDPMQLVSLDEQNESIHNQSISTTNNDNNVPVEQSYIPKNRYNKQFRGSNNQIYYTSSNLDDDVLL